MGTWLSGLFTGSSPGLTAAEGTASNIAGFGTGTGESATNIGLGFEEGLLSGNQAEEAKLLAPEIQNISNQANQKTQTNAEFGTRSGGVDASNQTTIDTARANVDNMISQLTGNAAGAVTQAGTSLLGTGLSASEAQAQEAEMQLQNEQNSVLGTGIYGAEGIGLGAAGKKAGLGAFGF